MEAGGAANIKFFNGGEGVPFYDFFSTREEVPPILLIFEEKLMGDWVSQSSRPQAPGRGLEGGRRSGLTPSGSFSRKEQEGRFLEPGKEEPGGVGGVEVVQEERWEEMRPRRGYIFKNNSRDIDC